MARLRCCALAWLVPSVCGQAMSDITNVDVMMDTLRGLEQVAVGSTNNGLSPTGTRDRATSGHNLSVSYVIRKIAEIHPTLVPVQQTYLEETWRETEGATLKQTAPQEISSWKQHVDFTVMKYSGGGSVSGRGVSPPGGDIKACKAEDFASFQAGHIALVQRGGGCNFCVKVGHARASGAIGVLVQYTEGDGVGASRLRCDWGKPEFPVFGITWEVGKLLLSTSEPIVHMSAKVELKVMGVTNLILDLPGGDKNAVIIAGAHLDSVLEGPGINDDGSGTAVVLEVLRAYGKRFGFSGNVAVKNGLRLCWWASEEWGLLGSRHYVKMLTAEQNRSIAGYLNFDMMASKNGFNSIINGSDDKTNPAASGYIQHAYESAFEKFGQNWSLWGISGSDFVSFAERGIPMGAIRTGAGQIKTEEEAQRFGGTAGASFDDCYHKACDTIDNVDPERLLLFGRVAATLVEDFVTDTELRSHLKRGPPVETVEPIPPPSWTQVFIGAGVGLLLGVLALYFVWPEPKRVGELMAVEMGPRVGPASSVVV